MSKWLLNAIGIAILIFLGLVALGGFVLEWHLLPVVDSYGGGQSLVKLNQALDTINRPCATEAEKAAKKDHPCGTLENLDKAMVKVGDILVTSQYQERDVAKAAEHDMAAVDGLASHLNSTADALTGTANGATGLLNTTNTAIGALNDKDTGLKASLAKFDNLMDAGTDTITKGGNVADNINVMLKSQAIQAIPVNVATVTGNFAATTTDFQTKFHALLYPQPCHTAGCRWAKAFVIVKDGSQLLEPAYFGQELIQSIVK